MDQLLVALDVESGSRALRLADELRGAVGGFKIGKRLFTLEGPAIVRALVGRGDRVFLDLKFHDIPNTVAGAVRRVAEMGVRLTTVHASGGSKMMAAAVEAAGASCGVLAVTVLTSLDDRLLGEAWGKDRVDVEDEVLRMAELARSAGVHGIVCSGQEAAAVHGRHGQDLKLLVPGIRLPGDAPGDQARVMTPSEAAAAGASYLVIGRSVTTAPDPRVAMQAVLDSLPRD